MPLTSQIVRRELYVEFADLCKGDEFSNTKAISERCGRISCDDGSVIDYWAAGYPIKSSVRCASVEENLELIARALNSGDYYSIKAFDGPFLVLIFQVELQKVIVARDKFGLRSGYYSIADGVFAVSDKIEIIEHKADVRITAISEWLHYGAPLAPLTMFHGVHTISPGSILEVSLKEASKKVISYFAPEEHISSDVWRNSATKDKRTLAKDFKDVFNNAVENSLLPQSDTTILLSGGVDSSLLTAYVRAHSKVSAITIDIYGPGSESEVLFADLVSKKLGVDLQVVRFGPPEFVSEFCKTVRDLGCPIIIENAVALNHAARSGALPQGQLIMDGEGADALMAGSTSLFKYSMMIRHLARLTPFGAGNVRRLFELMRVVLAKSGIATRTTLDGAGLDIDLAARRMELKYLESRIAEKFSHLKNREDSEISSLMLREFYDYLVPLMLRIDKMSAISGSHTVLPFLSAPVFSFLSNLDMSQKIGTRGVSLRPTTKLFLKSQLEEYLPSELVYRPKVGFGIPAWNWVNYPRRWRDDSWVGDFFQLDKNALNHWIDNSNSRDKVFFLSLEIWGRIYGQGLPFEIVEADWLEQHDSIR